MDFTPRPHQVQNAALLYNALAKYGGALDGSDTGTGKTYSFLHLCKELNARPFVITRKAVIPAWRDACELVGVDPVDIVNYEACRTKGFPHGRTVLNSKGVVTSYDWNITTPRVLFCFDEAQSLRNNSTVNSKMAIDARGKYKTTLLSATPFQTPLEAETIGRVVRLFSCKEYYRWLYNHGCKKNYFGHMEFIGDKRDPAKGLEIMGKIHQDLFPERGCRTRRSEIPGFPESLYLTDSVETGATHPIVKKFLDEIDERAKADHEKACTDVDPEFHHLVDVLPLVRDLRHRQRAEMLKVESIVDMAEMHASRGEKVAIFVNFDSTVDALQQLLKGAEIITGRDLRDSHMNVERVRVTKLFQGNYRDYIIVNSAAGGVGLSLHDPEGKVPRTALISPPYSAVMLRQVLGRVHRLGGAFSTQRLLFARGTIEETSVKPRVENRLANLDALLDSDLLLPDNDGR